MRRREKGQLQIDRQEGSLDRALQEYSVPGLAAVSEVVEGSVVPVRV